jgi:hypothetical protein
LRLCLFVVTYSSTFLNWIAQQSYSCSCNSRTDSDQSLFFAYFLGYRFGYFLGYLE